MPVQYNEEGSQVAAAGSTSIINFTGAGVDTSFAGNTLTVNVPNSGGGGWAAVDATNTVKGILKLTNDLGGTADLPVVAKINGVAVSGTCASGNVITGDSASTASWKTLASAGILSTTGNLAGITDAALARTNLGLTSNSQGDVSLTLSASLTLVLDGTTDNGPIINTMLAGGWDTVEIPDSVAGCKIATQVILTTGKALRGVPGRSRVLNHCDSVPMVVFRGSDTAVSDLNIECSLSNTSDVFRLDTATIGMERVTISNVATWSAYGGVSDSGGANYAVNFTTDRVHFRTHRGPGVVLAKAYAFTELNNTLVDRIGTATAANHAGFSFSGFQGISLDNCEVTGTKAIVSGTNSSQTGFVFSNGQVVFANKCFADTCGGVGLSFNTVDYVRPTNCTASLCDGIGMSFSTCNHVEATNLTVGGRNGTGAGNFTASIDGVAFATCGKVAVSTIAARNCTGSGIAKSGTSQVFAVTAYVLTNNTVRGIVDSSSGAAVFSGGVCSGNTAGNVSLASALQAIYATQVNSGGFLNAQAGPFTG
ncbi:MAG: hypothetical protein IPO35_16670 [Uliginosibacterium sp.]|nr:hypothetical protein [Uliginosibacterium sp.]